MLGCDIEKVESALGVGLCYEELRDAWQRIKTELVVVAKTTTNRQSAPLSSTCIGCGAVIDNVYCNDCRRRLSS
jgi:hypothetical protein